MYFVLTALSYFVFIDYRTFTLQLVHLNSIALMINQCAMQINLTDYSSLFDYEGTHGSV